MERRDLLKMIALATGTAMIGIGPVLAQAPVPEGVPLPPFSPDEIATLDELSETIIPRTATPGAKDAEVAKFMDVFVRDCYAPAQQAVFRDGIADLDRRAEAAHGKTFRALAPAERKALVTELDREAKEMAKGKKVALSRTGMVGSSSSSQTEKGQSTDPRDVHYFTMMKQLTLFGFFTSEIGATKALRYEEIPGRYDGAFPYRPGEPAWATV